ncbi:hypothetical protein COLO4_28150 [Corchorus olitorius]|uniref:Uncharacterized protein n=1 Tax=Corchorus olitorius TaxID=93759 RepID=A0A1R3HN07_9ROSI|nr:hypothetical protein COLO4_28150 [Corchorus olitorius]
MNQRHKVDDDCLEFVLEMNPIYIQQDNARTHVGFNGVDFCQAAKEGGLNIILKCQPPNSPDLILDLGFFRAIQSLQQKGAPKTVDELVSAVMKAFEEFSSFESNKIFLTLQTVMEKIIERKGCNVYDVPHIGKEKLDREGRLPKVWKCDRTIVQEARELLGDSPTQTSESAAQTSENAAE